MLKQTAILQKQKITRKGEINYFQVALPGTVKKIIAVETSVVCYTDAQIIEEDQSTAVIPDGSSGDPGGSGTTSNNSCPNPGAASFTQLSSTLAGAELTQVFQVGAAVNPGFSYNTGVYSVVLTVVADDGDTPASIAAKVAAAINNTTLATWSQYGSNNHNYKPTASSAGDLMTVTVDNQHSFFASGNGSCSAAPPPPPPPDPVDPPPVLLTYDPLFTIRRQEKAGVLALQSPDATDIFFQSEVFRDDRNIRFADYTFVGSMPGEWLKGRKRYATEVLIETESPILEAYYKDELGLFHGKDLNYELNLIIWFEKEQS
ncbi:MAG: hypothetical protein QM725_01435 [Lacibacter sp.]